MAKNRPEILTPAKKAKLLNQFLVLAMAYDMDEPEFDGNPQKLMNKYDKMCDYFNAMENHLLTVDKVRALIREKTGVEVKFD